MPLFPSPSIEQELEAIRADRRSGAARLAERALELLGLASAPSPGESPGALLPRVASLARRIRGLRPSMAAPGNWATAFLLDLRERLASSPDPPDAGRAAAEALLARLRGHPARVAGAAKAILEGRRALLTLSHSSTVEAVLLQAALADCLVIVAESRPLLEGRALIRRLLEAGRPVRLVTDAQIALAMREADLLLLGADTLCRDGAAVNKTGSHPAALAADAMGKPCAVLADTFKVSGELSSGDIPLEEGGGEEVWEEAPGLCRNVYFEPVPAGLITFYVTEKGVLSHREIREEAGRWRRLAEEAERIG
ncbi:MAG: hypothetical protein HYZ11_12865 [Candidatus Tectomicrobia bacterium]|uniref:Translation initiation factor eIF-2B n=1 Tax=Tectimicrobiota bacterium TaxID=2528274 RepID=A0A932HZB5_UNCTE|nr:hypothetical protein [Candidatus Tectomicrobia bacterium]